jgi:hypothetical protein
MAIRPDSPACKTSPAAAANFSPLPDSMSPASWEAAPILGDGAASASGSSRGSSRAAHEAPRAWTGPVNGCPAATAGAALAAGSGRGAAPAEVVVAGGREGPDSPALGGCAAKAKPFARPMSGPRPAAARATPRPSFVPGTSYVPGARAGTELSPIPWAKGCTVGSGATAAAEACGAGAAFRGTFVCRAGCSCPAGRAGCSCPAGRAGAAGEKPAAATRARTLGTARGTGCTAGDRTGVPGMPSADGGIGKKRLKLRLAPQPAGPDGEPARAAAAPPGRAASRARMSAVGWRRPPPAGPGGGSTSKGMLFCARDMGCRQLEGGPDRSRRSLSERTAARRASESSP